MDRSSPLTANLIHAHVLARFGFTRLRPLPSYKDWSLQHGHDHHIEKTNVVNDISSFVAHQAYLNPSPRSHLPCSPPILQISRFQSLANSRHPTRNSTMRHLIRQSLLQRTLRDTRIVQITEAAAHAGRTVAPLLRGASLLRG